MKMTFLELRRNPKKLLEVIERNEVVALTLRGKEIAKVVPSDQKLSNESVNQHPAFGMWADCVDLENPAEFVRNLRKDRFIDL